MDRTTQIINFIKEVEKLKKIIRLTFLSDQKTQEDDTQHSRHMTIMLMCLKDEIWIEFDMLKTMKMIMLHDLWEIYVWDSFVAFDKEAKKLKDKKEKESLDQVLSILPEDIKEEFSSLVREYINLDSIEAKITKALDRLQYQIQYLVSWGLYKWKWDFERSTEHDYKYWIDRFIFNDYLKEIFIKLIEESKKYK
jgi:putative hydrolase of HD superfamily